MEIKFIKEHDYKIWDDFCNGNSYTTFWHTTRSMKYYIDSSFNIKAHQKSFMVYKNNKIVGCIPVFLENINGEINLSYGGGAIPSPIIDEKLNLVTQKKVRKFIFENIDKIAYENKIKKITMYIPSLSSVYINNLQKYNYLQEYGYIDVSDLTCIIDLSRSEQELFSNFSKGHKSDIKKAEGILKLEIINETNVTKNRVYDFMNYYFRISGKNTRPMDAFDNIYEWIKSGYAVLLKATYNSFICGYSLFAIYKDTSYYAMACKDENYIEFNISHFLQWKAIKYLKDRGVKYLDVGIQYFGDTLNSFPSDKDKNISKFKRGFGGFIIPVFKGEKFYDNDEFMKCYRYRIKKYIERNL